MIISRKKIEAAIFAAGVIALFFGACNDKEAPEANPTLPIDTIPAVTPGDTTPPWGLNAKVIPLSGNTFVMKGTGTIDSQKGIVSWANPATVYSTFFRLTVAGDLSLFLRYSASSSSVIEATVGPAPDIGESFAGETFTLTLPKSPVVKVSTPIGSTTVVKDTTILIAKFDNRARGYQRIDFKGVSSDGTFFPDVSALVVNGKSTQLMTYVPASAGGRQNSPSVHMGYDYNKTDTAEWFYNEVTVPEGMDHTASYFMVSGFRGGYFGIQPQPSATTTNPKVRVLFSVWAPFNTDDPASIPDSLKVAIVKGGDGVKIQSFGGEGSGTQTFISTNANETPVDKQVVWKTGTTYKCFVRIFPSRNIGFTGYAATDYIAYFYDPDKSEWRLMAWLRRPYLFPRQEVPHYYEDAYSFVENFSGETGHLLRKACFGNQWIRLKNKTWKELTKGHFSVDATGGAGHRLDYGGGVTEDNKFYLQNGGFFNNNSTPGAYFNRTPTGISPDVDFAALEALLQPEWDNQLN